MPLLTKNNLKISPIYNMSMCSLENFHTCFLKWIGQNYPAECVKILTGQYIDNNNKLAFEDQVSYGNQIKLDLQINLTKDNQTEYIVVENKLKSFPTSEQLDKYSKYFSDKKATLILLSLAPAMDLPNGWQYMNYLSLSNAMQEVFNEHFAYKSDYHKFLIQDYISVVSDIANKFPAQNSQMYDFYESNKLDEIGLKDIYVKYRTSELANYIQQKLNRDDWYIGYSFHNKKGTLDIVKDFQEHGFNIGIQIEDNQYRYFMNIFPSGNSKDTNRIREKIATDIALHNYWFNNTEKPSRPRIYENFCGYAPAFIYRYFYIDKYFGEAELSKVSYDDIANQIVADVQNLDKNIDKIKQIISDVCMEEKHRFINEIQPEIEKMILNKSNI